MKKINWISVLMIALCVLILVGTGITAYSLLNPTKGTTMIRLDLTEGAGGKIVTFSDLTMIPGESSKYCLLLSSEVEDEFEITLHFSEIDDKLLKEFAYVRIENGDELLCDKRLSEVLLGEPLTCTRKLSNKTEADIRITYYLPEDVGNEAQGTAAEFELMITASNDEVSVYD